jgi:hypothetical protein
MATPHEKLAQSLTALQALQREGQRIIESSELSRVHRERLLANGFLQAVIKGWLISSSPGARSGDSTPWYGSFWEFCARYCSKRFGDDWHVSPEQSLLLLAENTVVPKQVVVYSPKGTNHSIDLLFGTSLYDLRQRDMPLASDLTVRNGLRLFSAAAALVKVPESFFARQPIESQVALAGLRDASDLLRLLLTGGNSVKGGIIAGALRRIGRPELADDVLKTMRATGYDARETDPFASIARIAMPWPRAAILGPSSGSRTARRTCPRWIERA